MTRRSLTLCTAGPALRLLGCLVPTLVLGCLSSRPAVEAPRHGTSIEAVLSDTEGQAMDLASLHGKVVMVDVFASWCVPCRHSIPFYQELQRRYGEGLTVVPISIDEDEQALREFMRELSMRMRVFRDPDRTLADRLGVDVMPTLFILDRQGHLRQRREAYDPAERDEVERVVTGLLAEPITGSVSATIDH